MNLTAIAIEKRAVTYFVLGLLVIAGVSSFFELGQLEDPEFSIKTATVITKYPGASPREVELEVTDRLEKAIQELPALKKLYSTSKAGISTIKVDIKDEYWSDRLPQVWDELRNKVADAAASLPPGVGEPAVGDDFGFVYGFLLAVTGDGYSYAELEEFAEALRKELGLVDGVSRVDLWGVQPKTIYLDVSEQQLSSLGLSGESIAQTLQLQNAVVDAGWVDVGSRRLRITPTGEFTSPEDIENLFIQPTFIDSVQSGLSSIDTSGELIRIGDIGQVVQGHMDPPPALMRFDGKPAIGIALANVSGGNVVHTGANIERRLAELMPGIPLGLEIHKVSWQADEVTIAISNFMVSLGQAIVIVLAILTVVMGWRMGVIIGSGLVLTILATFLIMAVMGIDLQRMSLGALIIALGMMVDNSIVVADGIYTRLQQGMDRKQAAIESASSPSMPLLGATVIAVMTFYPIFASTAGAGEYCRSLFTVVGIALISSWLISMTITPIQCMDMLPGPSDSDAANSDPYATPFFQKYRALLELALRRRAVLILSLLALLVVSAVGFGYVKQLFFPDSSRNQFMVDYWAPEGTRIQSVSDALGVIEARLMEEEQVTGVATFVGAGPPRFYLPVDSEAPNSSYGQIIINVKDFRKIPEIVKEMESWAANRDLDAMIRVRPYGVGPSDTWKFEARFSGPAEADLAYLRELGERGMKLLATSPLATDTRMDIREPVRDVVPDYSQERARWAGIDRQDIARATKRNYDGLQVGMYREGTDLYPILLRHTEDERSAAGLGVLQIQPTLSTETVPLSQVVSEIRTEWTDPVIIRSDRRRAVTVQGSPLNSTFPALYADIGDEFAAMAAELPQGYELFWDGELFSSKDAQESLIPGMAPAFIFIILIIVGLFNAYRPPVIILLTIPFALIGITWGLLATNSAFGFVALLGAMSLVGMMIKNSIVLLDQVNIELDAGRSPYDAIITAGVSRLRPVMLAAATTVLGVVPLLPDVFWVGMAVTIMAGLTFGSILTMVLVPVLYAMLYKVPVPGKVAPSPT
jgi:multidrug efflux pump subunit AcrB